MVVGNADLCRSCKHFAVVSIHDTCKFNSSRFHMKKEGRETEEGGLLGASSYIIKRKNTH